MTLKIENTPVKAWGKKRENGDFREFVFALRDLKKGQSFLWELASNDRTAINIVSLLLERKFVTRAEDKLHRIGRVL